MKRVVIIEDQTAIRELLAGFIRQTPGYEVVGTFGDGEEGLAQCLKLQPGIIVLDLGLPGCSGLEVLKAATSQIPNVRVLVFSGRGSPASLREAFNAGALGYVDKTDGADELKRSLEIVANGGTFIGPTMTAAVRTSLRTDGARKNPLSPRETQILQLVASGLSSGEIACKLTLSERTVNNHRSNIMGKLDLHNVAALTRYVMQEECVSA